MKIAVLALATMEALISFGALAATPLNALTGLTCDLNVSVGYENGAASVACSDQKTGQLYNIWVMEGSTPSPAEVIAFIQPYTMERLTLATLGTPAQYSSFNRRIFLRLNNGKITGMELQTSPGK